MVAGAVLLATLAQSSSGPKIDFSCPATRAEVVLARLSKATGTKLRAAPAIASDVLVIRVKAVTTRDLLAHIASAAGATWRTEGETTFLEPSVPISKERCQQVVQGFADRIRQALDVRIASPEYTQPWDESAAARLVQLTNASTSASFPLPPEKVDAMRTISWRQPSGRAVVALLSAIGPDDVAARAFDGAVVYATDPTSMQVGLPAVDDILNRYLAEQVSLVDATTAAGAPDPSRLFFLPGLDRAGFQGGKPSNGIGKALLRISGDRRDRTLTVEFTLADSTGKVLSTAYRGLSLSPTEPKVFAPAGDDSPIPLDSLTGELIAACPSGVAAGWRGTSRMVSSGGEMHEISLRTPVAMRQADMPASLRNWILSPDTNEPLGLGLGSLTSTTAQRRGENLVADLDDRAFADGLKASASRVTPSAWLSSTALQTDHEVHEASGWLDISLRDPEGARLHRVSRSGLADLVKAMERTKILTLQDLAAFAQTQADAPLRGFDKEYMTTLNPPAALQYYCSRNWPLYRLMGALSPEQRAALKLRQSFSMAELTPAAQDAVRRLVFESAPSPRFTVPQGMESPPELNIRDWTELLPAGVPGGTVVGAQTTERDGAYCFDPTRNVAAVESITDLARDRYVAQAGTLQQYRPPVAFSMFAPVRLVTYHLRFRFSPELSIEEPLVGEEVDFPVSPVPLTSMPPSFTAALDQEYAAVKPILDRMGAQVRVPRSVTPP